MPNWVYNKVILQGEKSAVHEFVKIGLKNSKIESTGDLERDFKWLIKEAKCGCIDGNGNLTHLEKGLTARTFLPLPETFRIYDTTNYPDKYPDAAKEQMEKYGAVGWYDYNKKTLGTKWDFKLGVNEPPVLENLSGDIWRIVFLCDTAWCSPTEWLVAVKNMVPQLHVMYMSHETGCWWFDVNEVIESGDNVYMDYTPMADYLLNEYNEKREKREKEIRADAKLLESIYKKATRNADGSVVLGSPFSEERHEQIENNATRIIEDMLDDEFGAWVNLDSVYENMEKSLEELSEKYI